MNRDKNLQRAQKFLQKQDYFKAIREVEPLIQVNPDDAEAWWLMAQASLWTLPDRARVAVHHVLRLQPGRPDAVRLLHDLDQRSGINPAAKVPPVPTPPVPTPPVPTPVPEPAYSPTQPALKTKALPTVPESEPAYRAQHPAYTPPSPPEPAYSPTQPAFTVPSPAPPAPSTVPPLPAASSTAGTQSQSDYAAQGCAAGLLAVPIGGYVMATLLVFEVILGFVVAIGDAFIQTGGDPVQIVFGIIITAILLIPLVLLGIAAAAAGAIVGAAAGAGIGLWNLVVTVVLSLVYRPLARIVAPLTSATLAVVIYHMVGFDPIAGIADGFKVGWIAYLNYPIAALGGLLISYLGLLELDDTAPASRASAGELGGALAAPWKLYGRLARGSLGVGANAWVAAGRAANDSMEKDQERREYQAFRRDLKQHYSEEDIRRAERIVEQKHNIKPPK